MNNFRILIVDDEPPARKKIKSFLKQENNVVVFEASNGKEAIQYIQRDNINLVFLDIQMPGMNGFEVIETVGIDQIPQIVFVTAYDQYALDAFEVQAVDYLLKPYDEERFKKSFHRALQFIRNDTDNKNNLKALLQEIQKDKKYVSRIMVKVGGKYFFIHTNDIYYLSAEGNYVQLHLKVKTYLVHRSLSNLEGTLNPKKFIRIHRSSIINIDYLKEIHPWSHGDAIVILKNEAKITLSRRFRNRLFDLK